jgi:glutamate-ammonia-ligase adenylyltransferase
VQYLVLGHACDHPELTDNIGNIALLRLAGKLGLIHEETAERALGAYREFRRIQHRLRLSGDSGLAGTPSTEGSSRKFARVEADYLKDGSFAVLRLWDEVFGTSRL